MRGAALTERRRRQRARHHPDGHPVELRALPDYDALFGVDFTTTDDHGSEHCMTATTPKQTTAGQGRDAVA